ncbi:PREDICTED: uncharacterized protein LOC106550305 [Thamnophis sirtalis]|uniref:Uncharacterized protein LOC106550305 n=1 Tax=Thamnophis sirtalis TaxID=35019 RepID=A0A6I9YI99_9SAUR|nr:PREDICTED: uncharacterized protein LOC106550305 [Thamnophis sirtalis]
MNAHLAPAENKDKSNSMKTLGRLEIKTNTTVSFSLCLVCSNILKPSLIQHERFEKGEDLREKYTMFPSALIKKSSLCSFDSKEKFSTNLKLALERNQIRISQCKAPPERQGWMCQPPDFSYKVYLSSRKPVGKFQELKKKEKKKTFFEDLHRIRSGLIVPEDNLGKTKEEDKQTKIVTRFPYTGSFESKLMFMKMGKCTSNIYQDPKPYDFRQYEQRRPDFVTSYARDPLNLKFKSQCLSKIYGLPALKDEKKKSSSKEKFITHKPKELKWDSKLFLPKEPWPMKACSFTRHRYNRGAPCAIIDRVEETLSKLLLKEAIKNQKEIRRKTAANIKKKLPSISVPIQKQQLTGRKKEKNLPKTLHSPSLSLGRCEWSMAKGLSIVKPEPLGFLLPTGIAQTVQELKYKE